MKKFCAFIVILLCASAFSQQPKLNMTDELRVIPLWEHGAPGALGNADADIPTLTIYPALKPAATRTAVVVAPGGGLLSLFGRSSEFFMRVVAAARRRGGAPSGR